MALITQPSTTLDTPWGQVLDAVIGVEIAISLLPPAAVVGIGYVLGSPASSANALLLLALNLLAIDVVGSASILAVRGVRRRYLQLEKQLREIAWTTIGGVPGFILDSSTIDVTLRSGSEARIDIILRREFHGSVPADLAETITSNILLARLMKVEVAIEVVPILRHTATPPLAAVTAAR